MNTNKKDLFIRSLCSWKYFRQLLVGLAVLATVWAVFVAEENWRCKRDWENYKRAAIAKGEWHEWQEFVPPPVPDEQNVLAAPRMAEWFVRPKGWRTATSTAFSSQQLINQLSNAVQQAGEKGRLLTVAEVAIVRADEGVSTARGESALGFDDLQARTRAQNLIRETIGPSLGGVRQYTFVTRPFDAIEPVRIWLRSEKNLTIADISTLFPTNLVPSSLGRLQVTAVNEGKIFRIQLNAPPKLYLAKDFLRASAVADDDLEHIRKALGRPQVRVNGDYDEPYQTPMVNFVSIRNVTQLLAERAQCHLLQNEPEQALRELTLLYQLHRLPSESRPTTLVAAMINVAVSGIYASVIADGFRLNAWQPAQITQLQKQLEDIDELMPPILNAFRMERWAMNRTCEQAMRRHEMVDRMFSIITGTSEAKSGFAGWFQKLAARSIPTGWVYQNLRIYNETHDINLADIYDTTNRQVHPAGIRTFMDHIEKLVVAKSPYTRYAKNMLVAITIPNLTRAYVTGAHNQTLLDEALTVCGLERYRQARGQYPESLAALSPEFLKAIPHDLLGGQPLKYHRTEDGKFQLYSIGWNERDDGGLALNEGNGSAVQSGGDWVWNPTDR